MLDPGRWKVIGQYRNIPLPEIPLDSRLPHRLGKLPRYFNRYPASIKAKPEPVKPNCWVQPKGS